MIEKISFFLVSRPTSVTMTVGETTVEVGASVEFQVCIW